MKINLGCGTFKMEGYIGLDIRNLPAADIVGDAYMVFKLRFIDESLDEVYASHFLEHLEAEYMFELIDKIWEKLKPTGYFTIRVPKALTRADLINPDHKTHFHEDTFGFFQVPADGIDPHGYLQHFWHVEKLESPNPEEIYVRLHPNKEGGKYPYKEIHIKS